MDSKIEKWKRWCTGPIQNNVLTMHLHRDTWRRAGDLIADNDSLPDSYWWEFMKDTYSTTQVIAVRRQSDLRDDVASLARLIYEIAAEPARLTKEYWVGLWDSTAAFQRAEAERGWNSQFADGTGKHLDPAMPTADLASLLVAVKGAKDYANSHVAHTTKAVAPAAVTLTLEDVHAAVDLIGELFNRYHNLLTGSSMVQLVPVVQGDWMAVFRYPWARPSTDPA